MFLNTEAPTAIHTEQGDTNIPFEHIAGSVPTLQLPQAPSFNPIRIDRPIVDTASIVQHATDSINQILQQMSPQARLQRQIQYMQLQAQQHLYQDYSQHPQNYQLTMNGPVPRDPYKLLNEAALFKTRIVGLQKQQDAAADKKKSDNFFDSLNASLSPKNILSPEQEQARIAASKLPPENVEFPAQPPVMPDIPDESTPNITPPTDTAQQ